MAARNPKLKPRESPAPVDGVDCAPVKCKLHISQRERKIYIYTANTNTKTNTTKVGRGVGRT